LAKARRLDTAFSRALAQGDVREGPTAPKPSAWAASLFGVPACPPVPRPVGPVVSEATAVDTELTEVQRLTSALRKADALGRRAALNRDPKKRKVASVDGEDDYFSKIVWFPPRPCGPSPATLPSWG
jgi:hypothetical protein